MRDWEGFRRFWAVFGLIFLTGALLAIVWIVASSVVVLVGATWPKKR